MDHNGGLVKKLSTLNWQGYDCINTNKISKLKLRNNGCQISTLPEQQQNISVAVKKSVLSGRLVSDVVSRPDGVNDVSRR